MHLKYLKLSTYPSLTEFLTERKSSKVVDLYDENAVDCVN